MHTIQTLLVLVVVLLAASSTQAQDRGLLVEPPTGEGTMDPVDLIRAENPLQEFDIVLETIDGKTSASGGETVQFAVRSERSGYVTLLNQNPDGQVIFLYPNQWSPAQRIERGETVYFPASERDFRIRVAPPFGREYVKAIVTPEPLIDAEEAERFYSKNNSPLLQLEGPPEGGGSDDLGGFDPSQWGTASMYLNTAPEGESGGDPLPVPEAPTAYYSDDPESRWAQAFQAANGSATRSMEAPQHNRMQTQTDEAPDELLVLYKPRTGTRAFGNSIGGGSLFNNIRVVDADRNSRNVAGTRSLSDYGDTVEERLEGLRQDDDVLVAIPNYRIDLFDAVERTAGRAPAPTEDSGTASATPSNWHLQWGLHNAFYRSASDRVDMRWRAALEDARSSDDPIIVAVIDSGVNLDNPNLAPILWKNEDEIPGNGIDDDGNGYVDDYDGWDAYDVDGNPNDASSTDSHGTFVASQIAVRPDSPDFYGLAPNVRIMPVRVLGPYGGSTEQVIEGIKYAARNGAHILNMSLGMTRAYEIPDAELFYREVFRMVEDMGSLVVMAAGNDSADSRRTYSYPARVNEPNTLTVAALDISGELAGFSNYGPRVELAAPGAQIIGHPATDRRVAGWDGTSMATPYVAAAAALIWSQNPDLTPAEVKERILDTVEPISGLDVKTRGLIDVEAALMR